MITSDKKHNFPKPVSFVVKDCQNGEGFNIGSQQISSDLETDLLMVETQLAKADLRRQTPHKISLIEMSQNSPKSLRAVSHKAKNKENESEYAGTAQSKVEIDSHETSKHYLISDIQQTPSVHDESRRELNEEEFDVPDDDIDLGMLDEVQKRMIKDRTVLSKKAPELNDQKMRYAYIRQHISNKDLIDRKAEQTRVLKQHEQNIKKDVR